MGGAFGTGFVIVAALALTAVVGWFATSRWRRRRERRLRVVALQELYLRRLAMPRDSIGLEVCLVGRAFVPFHPEPFQVCELFLERFLSRSLNIGVVVSDTTSEIAIAINRNSKPAGRE